MIPPQHQKKAAVLALAIPLIGGFEGLRQYAYRDPVGIPTICFGETRGVRMGQHHTVAECKAMMANRLEVDFIPGVERCVHVPMSPEREAAVLSFAYNVGVGAACRSGFVRKLNAGDPDACDELMKWNRAGGMVLPGLTRRREAERALCDGENDE